MKLTKKLPAIGCAVLFLISTTIGYAYTNVKADDYGYGKNSSKLLVDKKVTRLDRTSKRDKENIKFNLRFNDVPIPEGFKLQNKESFVFKTGDIIVGSVKYRGRGDVIGITDFFKKQMPLFDWEVVNSVEYVRSVLTFSKPRQNCVIIVEPFKGKLISFTIATGPKNV